MQTVFSHEFHELALIETHKHRLVKLVYPDSYREVANKFS